MFVTKEFCRERERDHPEGRDDSRKCFFAYLFPGKLQYPKHNIVQHFWVSLSLSLSLSQKRSLSLLRDIILYASKSARDSFSLRYNRCVSLSRAFLIRFFHRTLSLSRRRRFLWVGGTLTFLSLFLKLFPIRHRKKTSSLLKKKKKTHSTLYTN